MKATKHVKTKKKTSKKRKQDKKQAKKMQSVIDPIQALLSKNKRGGHRF